MMCVLQTLHTLDPPTHTQEVQQRYGGGIRGQFRLHVPPSKPTTSATTQQGAGSSTSAASVLTMAGASTSTAGGVKLHADEAFDSGGRMAADGDDGKGKSSVEERVHVPEMAVDDWEDAAD